MEIRLYQGLIEFNWNLLFSVITILVLFLILKYFFFEKVHNFMIEREKMIQDSLDNAANVNDEAEKKLKDYQYQISNVESESNEIIRKAVKEARFEAKAIVDNANSKAEMIVDKAKKEIVEEQDAARIAMKDEIANIAILAAKGIMEKDIEENGHDELIEKIIVEAGEGKWQS